MVLAVEVLASDRVDLGRRDKKIAQGLADVLNRSGFRGANLAPEGFGREAFTQRLGAAGQNGRDYGEHGACGVVERHGLVRVLVGVDNGQKRGDAYCVHDVVAAVEEAVAKGRTDNQLAPGDDGGLRQARGAGCVDEQAHVAYFILGSIGVRCAEGRRCKSLGYGLGREDDELGIRDVGLDFGRDVGC